MVQTNRCTGIFQSAAGRSALHFHRVIGFKRITDKRANLAIVLLEHWVSRPRFEIGVVWVWLITSDFIGISELFQDCR